LPGETEGNQKQDVNLDKILSGSSLEQGTSLIRSKRANCHGVMSDTQLLSSSIQNNILIERQPRRGWVENVKMDHRELGWDGVDWIELAQDRNQWRALVNTMMNLRVP
jgi:hypothetical protein